MNTDTLKELALAATPGDWFKWSDGVYSGNPEEKTRSRLVGHTAKICEIVFDNEDKKGKANQNYIAAAKPPTILALIAQRDELLAALIELRSIAVRCDGWSSFPEAALDAAHEAIAKAVQP